MEPKTITFSTITKNCNMVLFNKASDYKVAGDLELEAGTDYNQETEESIDIYQWYAIRKGD